MKIRNDYVSNSSSSSFIVVEGKPDEDVKYDLNDVVLPSEDGCYEFGWQEVKYDDFWSKLNWCAIILGELEIDKNSDWYKDKDDDSGWERTYKSRYREMIAKYDKWYAMLEKVCKEHFNITFRIVLDEKRLYAYIDHQSNIYECPSNAGMFESEKKLYTFLASHDSYIQCGNDNC